MHYVGNRALIMVDGDSGLQINYRTDFTIGSFFLPISLVGAAFYAFGISETVNVLWTLIGGILVGAGICGMHYVSQQGIVNYALQYSVAYIAGAAIIAVVTSTAVLGLFFYLTSMRTNSWLRRSACAFLLATAVSGFHWTATVGTSYRLKAEPSAGRKGLSSRTTAFIVIGLVSTSPLTLG